MSVWAQLSDVQARITLGALTTTTDPTTVEVQDWLDDAEAETRGYMRAAEIPLDYPADSDGGRILRKHITDYAEGRLRAAWASADGSGENEDGQRELDRYQERLDRLNRDPAWWSAMLSATGQSAEASRLARSPATSGVELPAPIYSVGNIDGAS